MINEGPEQNAEAKKRGARIDAFQNGLAANPLYMNAVTVCMLTAQGIDRRMKGRMKRMLTGF